MRAWVIATPVVVLGTAVALFFSCGKSDDNEAKDCGGNGASLAGPPSKGGGGGSAPEAPADCAGGGGVTGGGGNETGTGGSSGSTGTACVLADSTTETETVNTYGCPVLTRDTSSCKESREAQGLSGFWLKFSCSVTLTKSGTNVIMSSNNLPDYKSFYFSSSDACYDEFSSTERKANPNQIASQTITITVPLAPTAASSTTATPEGVIGMALNGVAIYDNSAAPGDDIYQEEATFDRCDGHPDMSSRYHYHTEPSTITSADDAFIGVMRDGFPIYGRNDTATGTTATGLDTAGGKTGRTVDSPDADVYAYHANMQTNGTDSAYFLAAGYYKGTPGDCTGCQ